MENVNKRYGRTTSATYWTENSELLQIYNDIKEASKHNKNALLNALSLEEKIDIVCRSGKKDLLRFHSFDSKELETTSHLKESNVLSSTAHVG